MAINDNIFIDKNNAPVLFYHKEECCGCAACYTVCPRKAISMQVDDEGFEYPNINYEKCINCHRCIEVCPLGNE